MCATGAQEADRDMAFRIRRINYYYATIEDDPGAACQVLTQLAELGVNLMAFTTVPTGPRHTQLTIFPADDAVFESAAQKAGLHLDGPHPTLFAQGDDELGALAKVHDRLNQAGVDVFASTGLTDDKGCFGYIVYVRPEAFQRAEQALGL